MNTAPVLHQGVGRIAGCSKKRVGILQDILILLAGPLKCFLPLKRCDSFEHGLLQGNPRMPWGRQDKSECAV